MLTIRAVRARDLQGEILQVEANFNFAVLRCNMMQPDGTKCQTARSDVCLMLACLFARKRFDVSQSCSLRWASCESGASSVDNHDQLIDQRSNLASRVEP